MRDLAETIITTALSLVMLAVTYSLLADSLTGLIKDSFALANL